MIDYEKIKLKYIAHIFTGNSIPDEKKSDYENKAIPYIPTKEIEISSGFIHYDNGLSVNKDDGFRIAPKHSVLMCIEGGSAGRKIGFTDRDVAFVNKLCCFYIENGNSRLLFYCLKSKDFLDQFFLNITGLIGGVSVSTLNNLFITFPKDICLQGILSGVLDTKCSQIDLLIANQEKQIEKLKAYKQSVITEAVTHGLDPTVPMKDSGVEWIGKIPENWTQCPLKSLFAFGKGLPITKADLIESGIPVISYGQIHAKYNQSITINERLYRYVSTDFLMTNGNSLVGEGDFIFADTSEDVEGSGDFVYIDKAMTLFAGYHTIILKRINCDAKKYLAYLFMSKNWKLQIQSSVCGVKLFSISRSILAKSSVILPTQEEQKQIVSYLDEKCSQIDRLIAIKQQKIDKLNDYKKSLIYEYVTGKKEVE